MPAGTGKKDTPSDRWRETKKKRQKRATKEHKKIHPKWTQNQTPIITVMPVQLCYRTCQNLFQQNSLGWHFAGDTQTGSCWDQSQLHNKLVEKIQYYNRHIYMYAMDDSTVRLQMCFSTDVDHGVPTAAYWFPFQSKSCSTIRCRGKQKDVTPERGSPELKDYNH